MNMNHSQRVQNIMFCGLWAFSCSLVHSGGFLAVLSGFGHFGSFSSFFSFFYLMK